MAPGGTFSHMRRVLLPCLALVLAASPLSGCDEGDERDGGAAGRPGSAGDSASGDELAEALAVVPADATTVQFVDRRAVAERLRIEDARPEEYLDAVGDDAVGGTDLLTSLTTMAAGAVFDERDVTWSVTAEVDQSGFSVYRLSDDVDLDALGDDLVEIGLSEDDARGGRRHFSGVPSEISDVTGLVGGVYPAGFYDVTLDSEDHLVLLGSDVVDSVLETVDGEAGSLADVEAVGELLSDGPADPDDAGDAELVLVDRQLECLPRDSRLTPEDLERFDEQTRDLPRPLALSYVVSDGARATAGRLSFTDEESAETDLETRRAYLDEAPLLSGDRFSDLGSAELSREGSVVEIGLDLRDPRRGVNLAQLGDGPFACYPVAGP
ncbi:hypothetical protein [Nocardioides sp.]|uniref:hypothetical protein n=1 Tax=Nocardioides sp. TaxID=35761 RepID=UPI002718DF1A|nr:hypothetical protein [Nocardioides sp.]MDO9455378.1 hypothetical protein [Nocardioides sp.]